MLQEHAETLFADLSTKIAQAVAPAVDAVLQLAESDLEAVASLTEAEVLSNNDSQVQPNTSIWPNHQHIPALCCVCASRNAPKHKHSNLSASDRACRHIIVAVVLTCCLYC